MIHFHAKYSHWWVIPKGQFFHEMATDFNKKIVDVQYILVDDEELLEINKKFLQHDYYTDIISFPLGTSQRIRGEIYISADRVRENALEIGVDKEFEMARVIIHGLLHFFGLEDSTSEEKQKMRMMEDKYLSRLFADEKNFSTNK
ncbi:MAG: rRNA maturation RNase YbeY [Flavobacteriales bacterium]|nr:MAG: rRNA maturation RNase YbeY [Flavobacteriales bacterium]